MDTRKRLEQLIDDLVAAASLESKMMWWPGVDRALAAVENDTILSAILGQPLLKDPLDGGDLNEAPEHRWLERRQIPGALEAWARLAHRSLVVFRRDHDDADVAVVVRVLGRGLGTLDSDSRWPDLRGGLKALLVDPIVRFLRERIQSDALLQEAVESWVSRCEWFGLESIKRPALKDADELEFQDALHRYVADRGFSPADIGREFHTVRGRVDFLLRDGSRVPVELKLWKGGRRSSRKLAEWGTQARNYPRDLQLRRGYLVIVNVNPKQRLELQPPLSEGSFQLGDIVFSVRIVDVQRAESSKEYQKRKAVPVMIEDLFPVPKKERPKKTKPGATKASASKATKKAPPNQPAKTKQPAKAKASARKVPSAKATKTTAKKVSKKKVKSPW